MVKSVFFRPPLEQSEEKRCFWFSFTAKRCDHLEHGLFLLSLCFPCSSPLSHCILFCINPSYIPQSCEKVGVFLLSNHLTKTTTKTNKRTNKQSQQNCLDRNSWEPHSVSHKNETNVATHMYACSASHTSVFFFLDVFWTFHFVSFFLPWFLIIRDNPCMFVPPYLLLMHRECPFFPGMLFWCLTV